MRNILLGIAAITLAGCSVSIQQYEASKFIAAKIGSNNFEIEPVDNNGGKFGNCSDNSFAFAWVSQNAVGLVCVKGAGVYDLKLN